MNREKEIASFLDNIKTQEDWETDKQKYIDNITLQYSNYLEDYKIVKDKNEYNMLKLGGYIRYIDSMDKLKWGGILIKKIKTNDIDYMIFC